MRTLSKKQVLALHSDLIREFGGTEGIRDEGLLESALAAPGRTAICSADEGKPPYGESPCTAVFPCPVRRHIKARPVSQKQKHYDC